MRLWRAWLARYPQNGYLIIHPLLSSRFLLSFFTIPRRARVKRGLRKRGEPATTQNGAIPGGCAPPPRADSFHSSAFDHPGRRIRYSNASEPVYLSPPVLPFALNPVLAICLSPFRGTSSVIACRLLERPAALPHRFRAFSLSLSYFFFFFISTTAAVYS